MSFRNKGFSLHIISEFGLASQPAEQKDEMAKRTETKTAILIQVMDELGFDREIIAKVSKVPQRTVSDIVNWKGYWGATPKVNELRGGVYRLYLRKCIQDDATALGTAVLRRFEELSKGADFVTALSIAYAVMTLASKFEDGR
jgi:hypothetical protein